jgi:WD40 repeat protein
VFTCFPAGPKAALTPDGHNVVALQVSAATKECDSDPDDLVVLDAATLAPVGAAVPLGYGGRDVSVTPDGRSAIVVVSTGAPGETRVMLVDLAQRRIVRSTPVPEFDRRRNGPRNNTVATNGRTVGLGGTGGDVVVVDAVTGKVSPPVHAHDDFVESITFAPDYQTFVTTGRDGGVKLWDAATQRLLGTLLPFGANHRVRASFLAADRLMIVDDSGKTAEWDPRPDAWEAYACHVAGRNLTKAEWANLFPGQPYRATCSAYPPGE